MDEVLRDVRSIIRLEVRDDNNDLKDADLASTVSAKITNSAGTEISGSPVNIVSAAAPHAGHPSTGLYEVTLTPAMAALLDRYDVAWTVVQGGASQKLYTSYEVVGGFICSIQEIREVDPKFADEIKYTNEKVVKARLRAQEVLERECGVAFRPKGRRMMLHGKGEALLLVQDLLVLRVVSASIGGTAFTSDEIADVAPHEWGGLERNTAGIWARGVDNVKVHYEYGFVHAPEPIRAACAELAASYLFKSGLSDRTVSVSSDEGTMRLAQAGVDGPTGIPMVDAVIEQFSHRVPGVA